MIEAIDQKAFQEQKQKIVERSDGDEEWEKKKQVAVERDEDEIDPEEIEELF